MHGLQKLISEPTHLSLCSWFCIDLTFTGHLNVALAGGVHPYLHPNCHHQIIYCKFNDCKSSSIWMFSLGLKMLKTEYNSQNTWLSRLQVFTFSHKFLWTSQYSEQNLDVIFFKFYSKQSSYLKGQRSTMDSIKFKR